MQFPFPKVGYVSFQEGIKVTLPKTNSKRSKGLHAPERKGSFSKHPSFRKPVVSGRVAGSSSRLGMVNWQPSIYR